MAEIKDKVVTVESLSVLHEYNSKMYMPMVNPESIGEMSHDGNASFSDGVSTNYLMIGSNVKLVPTSDGLEIMFLDEETIEEG